MEEKELIEALKLNIAVLENENKILKKQKKIHKKKILNLKNELASESIIKSFHLKVFQED